MSILNKRAGWHPSRFWFHAFSSSCRSLPIQDSQVIWVESQAFAQAPWKSCTPCYLCRGTMVTTGVLNGHWALVSSPFLRLLIRAGTSSALPKETVKAGELVTVAHVHTCLTGTFNIRV